MKYCKNCKRVSFTEDERCVCGKRFAKSFDNSDPAELITAEPSKQEDIERCLSKAEIPYSVQDRSGYSPSVGKLQGDIIIMVPISFLKKAIGVLEENGFTEKPEWFDKLPDGEPMWEEMPEGKARAVRILSIIGFLIVIYLCVAGVDYIANLLFGFVK